MADPSVLRALGVDAAALLGSGGEAEAFALPDGTVARVPRDPDRSAVDRRVQLLESLDRAAVPFLVPTVLDIVEVAGVPVIIERRLPGVDGRIALGDSDTATGERIVRAGLESATAISRLAPPTTTYGPCTPADHPVGGFGDVGAERHRTFHDWAGAAVERSYRIASLVGWPDAEGLATALPTPDAPTLTHLDAFLGNMLVADGSVTAVIDFGPLTSNAGDLLDPLLFAVYLDEAITPTASDTHRRCARRWLAEHDLGDGLEPARQWAAGFWAGAVEDASLHRWCRSILLGS